MHINTNLLEDWNGRDVVQALGLVTRNIYHYKPSSLFKVITEKLLRYHKALRPLQMKLKAFHNCKFNSVQGETRIWMRMYFAFY